MEKPLLRQLDLNPLLFQHISSLSLCPCVRAHRCTKKCTHAHRPDASCLSLHIICLLSINKHSYVSRLPGKHGMYVSWVLTLSHKPGIVQIHTNLTSFTPPGCELFHRANSERGDPQAGCALTLCTSLIIMYQTEAYAIFVSFHCIREFYRGPFVSNHSLM